MTKKIMLDPGHGGHDPGAVANNLKEKDLVLKIAKKTKAILEKVYGATVKLTRSTDVYIDLSQRARLANNWGADYFASIHINGGGGTGFETFRFDKLSAASSTGKQQKIVHDSIYKKIKEKAGDRGTKSKNLAVLRETKMPAILTENLFIDREKDAALLKQESFLDALAAGHADGIASAVGLKKVSSISKKTTAQPKSTLNKKYMLPTGIYKVKTPLMRGDAVKQIQDALAALYFYPDKGAKNNGIDSYYGPKTANAVRRFQLMHGLIADGIYGPKTKANLEALLK
ncbi:N-acetylmuramoyl-L-alanine amidase [Bacillus safensis]|uniref:N-acetylmuramoyl-L-alanine amidase n=1 Tax=Bacillus safensis TaxID=561879 RepID=UPI00227EBC72|nr:N-acetylmuramoyl-L-alanine amidase [Bacillus safensis]MCY7676048.1 N-acetylmuramoyl-L-alanine amidase [Bacillus safensis]MEC3628794.1 N-acetylmuramoyl-L-alanine amidase [Bacillus safensis]